MFQFKSRSHNSSPNSETLVIPEHSSLGKELPVPVPRSPYLAQRMEQVAKSREQALATGTVIVMGRPDSYVDTCIVGYALRTEDGLEIG